MVLEETFMSEWDRSAFREESLALRKGLMSQAQVKIRMSMYLSLNPHFIYDNEIWGEGSSEGNRTRMETARIEF